MPTDLGEPFAVTWRGAPQQMLPPDVPLWHLFLDRHAWQFERFYYNVRVGGPDISQIKEDQAIANMWYAATAKRIDVIAEMKNQIWIIEVASAPYIRAVGQCLTYPFLWSLDPKISKPALMVLLCYYIDRDLERVLQSLRVSIVKMPPPPQRPI
jgi:hypothetical protein